MGIGKKSLVPAWKIQPDFILMIHRNAQLPRRALSNNTSLCSAVPSCLHSSHLGKFLLNFCPWENLVFISYPKLSYKEREEKRCNDITCPEVKEKATWVVKSIVQQNKKTKERRSGQGLGTVLCAPWRELEVKRIQSKKPSELMYSLADTKEVPLHRIMKP